MTFNTSKGNVSVDLFDNLAPATVGNFLNYADHSGTDLYANTIFHSAIPGVTLSGGGWQHSLARIPDFSPVVNDASLRSNTRGTIAMNPSANAPNSSTSQWFFNLGANAANDTANGGVGITVFGWVVGGGMSVLDSVAALHTFNNIPTGNAQGDVLENLPLNGVSYVLVNSVTVVGQHPSWQNPVQNVDVNNDNSVTPQDALIVINDLNLNGNHAVSGSFSGSNYLDTSGNNLIEPKDVLLIINYLNKQSASSGASVAPQLLTNSFVSELSSVPEPSSWILIATGVFVLSLYAARRRLGHSAYLS